MPDDRASSEAARRRKAAERRGMNSAPQKPSAQKPSPQPSSPQPLSVPRPLWLRVVGWIAYALALAAFVVFVVLWMRGDLPKTEQLYPLPGVAAGFLIVGIWSSLGPWLYRSRSTATRAGKYVIAVVITVILYPLVVTILASIGQWIVSLIPGSPLH